MERNRTRIGYCDLREKDPRRSLAIVQGRRGLDISLQEAYPPPPSLFATPSPITPSGTALVPLATKLPLTLRPCKAVVLRSALERFNITMGSSFTM